MEKIQEITISLHCGSSREIVNEQMNLLNDLSQEYHIHWNNRIDRHPEMYSSYSEMINHAVATSKTEWIIFINDRVKPTVDEIKKMIIHLENGYACVMLYNVAFMGFSKELIRKVGWWDERYLLGGWEDRDWVWRMKQNNLCIYESLESTHDYSWKSHLNKLGGISSGEFWRLKWDTSSNYIVFKKLDEIVYKKWDLYLGKARPEISNSWKKWEDSKLDLYYNQDDNPKSGPSGSSILKNRKVVNNPKFGKKLMHYYYKIKGKIIRIIK
jgi:hypothetical protein